MQYLISFLERSYIWKINEAVLIYFINLLNLKIKHFELKNKKVIQE